MGQNELLIVLILMSSLGVMCTFILAAIWLAKAVVWVNLKKWQPYMSKWLRGNND